MDLKIVGERLKKLRGDMTIKSLADRLGVVPSAVSMYENGQRIPRDNVKIRYATIFGKTVEEIFFTK